MRIIDEITQQEITDPDLTVGELWDNKAWVSPEAYANAKSSGSIAVPDDAYEHVQIYHVLTEGDIAEREESELQQERQEMMDALPDAVADLSEMVSDNTLDTADIMDAIAELSEIVSNLMEGE